MKYTLIVVHVSELLSWGGRVKEVEKAGRKRKKAKARMVQPESPNNPTNHTCDGAHMRKKYNSKRRRLAGAYNRMRKDGVAM